MATWNADKPAVGNQISADIPDIEENFQELHDVITAITNGTLGTTTAANFKVDTITTPSMFVGQRSQFIWYATDQIYIGPGAYHHVGTVSQVVYWNSQLTLDVGSPDASNWYYVYIDDSAVVSLGTNLLTAAELIFSKTEPAWSAAKHGWYNALDRCIFAVWVNSSSNIVEFFHDGSDLVLFADQIISLASTDIDTTWTDVTMTRPIFSICVEALFTVLYVDGATSLKWRTNGQTGTTGHPVGYISAAGESYNTAKVATDANGKIEVVNSASNGNKVSVSTSGFYLSAGL